MVLKIQLVVVTLVMQLQVVVRKIRYLDIILELILPREIIILFLDHDLVDQLVLMLIILGSDIM